MNVLSSYTIKSPFLKNVLDKIIWPKKLQKLPRQITLISRDSFCNFLGEVFSSEKQTIAFYAKLTQKNGHKRCDVKMAVNHHSTAVNYTEIAFLAPLIHMFCGCHQNKVLDHFWICLHESTYLKCVVVAQHRIIVEISIKRFIVCTLVCKWYAKIDSNA